MRSFLTVFGCIALTFFCWGIYGPVLHQGQYGMGAAGVPSSLRPFICVGIAYFVIAVIVPIAWLQTRGEKGGWTMGGTIWSLLAGTAGALGALGIILAFKFRGSPVYVMPLVFGLAPIVNTFVTMWLARTFKEAGPIFYAGIVVVALGAAGLLVFLPQARHVQLEGPKDGVHTVVLTEKKHGHETVTKWDISGVDPQSPIAITMTEETPSGPRVTKRTVENFAQLTQDKSDAKLASGFRLYQRAQPLELPERAMIALAIALTALSWGSYGPVLHLGQMKMQGSRLRPLLCVGLAYFVIAVVAPLAMMPAFPEPGGWLNLGAFWSLAGGAAGAIGALGIIMAFTFGGKPIYVMPLVFGCAPLVNTLVTITHDETWSDVPLMFFVSLLLVVIGAVTVLIFSPKAKHGPPGKAAHGDSSLKHDREPAAAK
jgi:hypothetical protein